MKYASTALVIASLGLLAAFLAPSLAHSVPVDNMGIASTTVPSISHAQEVWLGALEWCESQGVPKALNPKDRDGTPSLGAFQFKPGTLIGFAKLYGIEISDDIFDYASQRAVMVQLVLHSKEIDWSQQFPDCTRRLGRPPL